MKTLWCWLAHWGWWETRLVILDDAAWIRLCHKCDRVRWPLWAEGAIRRRIALLALDELQNFAQRLLRADEAVARLREAFNRERMH